MVQHHPDIEAFRQAIHEISLGIHGGWSQSGVNEASVRQAVVLRVLHAAYSLLLQDSPFVWMHAQEKH